MKITTSKISRNASPTSVRISSQIEKRILLKQGRIYINTSNKPSTSKTANYVIFYTKDFQSICHGISKNWLTLNRLPRIKKKLNVKIDFKHLGRSWIP